jgi:redox-sensitive bicupin YhaK (pirin superfamily)
MTFDLIKPHTRDLGGFSVQRVLPSLPHKMVGPFIFFDHMGPATMPPGQGVDVRPHPHIGLATVTYLFTGSMMHRDSLGSVQPIYPGDVNWMIAGRGIVHSERNTPQEMAIERTMHGIQSWVALPLAHEQGPASFSHYPAATLPSIAFEGVAMSLIAGTAYGQTAPTPMLSPIFYLAVEIDANAAFDLPPEHEERAVYVVHGDVSIGGRAVPQNTMAVLTGTGSVTIAAASKATLMLLGGARMDGDRHINWNFVASSRELLQSARESWKTYPNEQFGQVPGETDWIPLPESN